MPRKRGPITEFEVVQKVADVASSYGFDTLNVPALLDFARAVVQENKAGILSRLDLHHHVVSICSAAYRRILTQHRGPYVYPGNMLADAFEQAHHNNL